MLWSTYPQRISLPSCPDASLVPNGPESSIPRMTGTVLVPRVSRASTKLRPEVPTRVRRTELRVDPLTIDEPQAMLSPAPFHQTGPVVRYVLVGRDVFARDEEAAGALHSWASKRDRLTRSAGLLAAVLAVVVTDPLVVVTARRRQPLRDPRVVYGVAAGGTDRVVPNTGGVDLTPSIHSLVAATVHVVLLIVVCRDVIVRHPRHLEAGSTPLLFVGPIDAARSLFVATSVSLIEELRIRLPEKRRSSSRHFAERKRISASLKAPGGLPVNLRD